MNSPDNVNRQYYEPPTVKKFTQVNLHDAFSTLSELEPGTLIAFSDSAGNKIIATFQRIETQSDGTLIMHYKLADSMQSEHQITLSDLSEVAFRNNQLFLTPETTEENLLDFIGNTNGRVLLVLSDGTRIDGEIDPYAISHIGIRSHARYFTLQELKRQKVAKLLYPNPSHSSASATHPK